MKKITFFFTLLFSVATFAQIDISADFNNNQIPAGWTSSGFATNALIACGNTGSAAFSQLNSGASGILTTPSATSNGTNLTVNFSYNVLIFSGTASPPPADWGTIVAEYSIDGGSTWTTITTINDSNFTYSGQYSCSSTGDISLGVIPDTSSFEARFVNTNNSAGTLIMVIDEVSFLQTATTVPNCDAVLTNPLNGATDADTYAVLSWTEASGLPTDYLVSVGTSPSETDIVNAVSSGGATTFDLSSYGLAFETTYNVTITPTNAFGSATGCTVESFTTRTTPLVGATCSNAKIIDLTTGFYTDSDDTNNFEDNIDSGSCGSNSTSYMNGKDVFYQITPATDMSINLDVAAISQTGAGMHIMKGCPDSPDKECVAFTGTDSDPGAGYALNLTEVVLLAGETYNIVLSNSGSTRIT